MNDKTTDFTNDLPTKAIPYPALISNYAGKSVTVKVELRADNGKLYNDVTNGGWY